MTVQHRCLKMTAEIGEYKYDPAMQVLVERYKGGGMAVTVLLSAQRAKQIEGLAEETGTSVHKVAHALLVGGMTDDK